MSQRVKTSARGLVLPRSSSPENGHLRKNFISSVNGRFQGSFICVLGISNLLISTIFLLNDGTVPTVWYIFFHFIISYEKKPAELQLLKKIWLWSSSVIKIVKMKYNRIDIKWWLVSTSFKIYLEIRSDLYITFTIFYYNTISLKCTFFSFIKQNHTVYM